MKYYNFKARQAGMTLIELTVVLLVLIGLAGLMIPYVSGFMSKTHDSTGTNNLARMNANFGRFENQFMRSPDSLETLVDASNGTVYDKMMNSDQFQAVAVGGMGPGMVRAMSLNAAGIQTFISNNDATTDATFASTEGNLETTFTTGAGGTVVNVAALCGPDGNQMMDAGCATGAAVANGSSSDAAEIEDHLADAFGGSPADYDATCFDYLALGVGDQSEMIGRSMQSAPIHFASNGDMGPTNAYNRFIAVYKVDKDNVGTATNTQGDTCEASVTPAKFVGTAMAMMQPHLWGLGHTAGHAYENIAAQ